MGQAQHLDQIGQRAFAAVVLPVGVGDEGDRGVEGKILGNRALAGRVERQHRLQPHQAVNESEAADMEQQHGDRVGQPVLLAPLVDAADPVDAALEGAQHGREQGALAVEHAGHVPAERLDQRDHDRAKQNNLNPADDGHCVKPFEWVRSAAATRTDRAAARSAPRRPTELCRAPTLRA
ncbi:hypothetical protein ABIF27_005911 [Bradyrhizobium elkanii]